MKRIPFLFQELTSSSQHAVDLSINGPSNLWLLSIKRIFDIAASILGLLLLTPFFGLIALLIALDSPGAVLYRQQRLGKHGKAFNLIKFRTMHPDADQILEGKLRLDPELRNEWEHYQKIRRDPRVTYVGRVLRRFGLDELPQLWNVLKGEMSLVGPRPMMVYQRELYGKAYVQYVQVLPGITGLWQVSGRNGLNFARRAELDREYIEAWSIWLDAYILLKTLAIVSWQRTAY